jgi:putative endonuclease
MDEKAKKELGKKGEALAKEYLMKLGYNIRRMNYIFNHAEIDIVASTGNEIIFVEVKTRYSPYLSDPSLLVPVKKQRKIISAADRYVKDYVPEKEWRFDIMIVITNKEYTRIEHIIDAFYPMV